MPEDSHRQRRRNPWADIVTDRQVELDERCAMPQAALTQSDLADPDIRGERLT